MPVSEGPLIPAASTLITINDPTVNSASDRVQIQNGSNFTLTVSAGPGQVLIPPNWSETVPSSGGANITILPGQFGNAGNGIILEWLYPSDTPPQDGQIFGQGAVTGAIPLANAITVGAASPTTYNIAIPPGICEVGLFVQSARNVSTALNLIGNVTGYGILYGIQIVAPGGTGINPQFFQGVIPSSQDTSATLSIQPQLGSSVEWFLYGYAVPPFAANTNAQPLSVSLTNPQPSSAHSANVAVAASGATAAVLAAPGTGLLWEIVHWSIIGGAPTANGTYLLQGHTSGNAYAAWQGVNAAVTNSVLPIGAAVYLNEGLDIVNYASGTPVRATVDARVVVIG